MTCSMQEDSASVDSLKDRVVGKIKFGIHSLIYHEHTKKFFDHKSSTAWKGAVAVCFVTVLLLWYPLGYIAAVVQYCVRGPLRDLLYQDIFQSIFYEESDWGVGMLQVKEGDFYEYAAEPLGVLIISFLDVSDLVVISIVMYLMRKKLRNGLLKLTDKLPGHFKAYGVPIVTTAAFTFGWAAARSAYPYIFGIIWNILFPALV